MNDCTPLHRLRCLTVWTCVTGAGLGLVTALAGDLAPGPDAAFEEVLVAGAAWALCAAAAWASTVTAVVALEAARSPRPRADQASVVGRAVPTAVRRLLLRACGVALTGGLVTGLAVAPSLAEPGTTQVGTGGAGARTLAPPPPAGPVSARPALHRAATPDAGRVTTRRGDSLWRVAEAELRTVTGQEPSDADVAAYWPRIHAANRVLLGPDPDFVLPGVPLSLPATDPSASLDKEQS